MNTDLVIALVFFIVVFCLLAAVNIWRSWNVIGPVLCCHLFRPQAKQQFRSRKNEMNQMEYDRIVNKNRMQPEKFRQQDPSSLPQRQNQPQQSQQGVPQQPQPNQPQQSQRFGPQQPQPPGHESATYEEDT